MTAPPKPRVLCIDDSLLVRKTITMALGAGVDLHCVGSAQEGIAHAQSTRPDLIITDINMPGMDGFQMLEVLKADERTRGIPVVALTGASGLADRERGVAAGFADYVTKSADLSALMRLVAHHTRPAG